MTLTRRISQPTQIRMEGDADAASTPVPVWWTTDPAVILGEARDAQGLPVSIAPSPESLFGPRGCCLIARAGPLWIADSGHHRLLGWQTCPSADGTPADWVIGQPDFFSEGRNAKAAPGPGTFNLPTGLTAYGDGLAVADAWNHRVLIWHRVPQRSHCPADLVLGQEHFTRVDMNRGRPRPSADTLYWPYGVSAWGEGLAVADAGNRRVLVWRRAPERNGQPADLVLGQASFDRREDNAGGAPSAMSMRWPHAIARWGDRLCVADAGNNRMMIWAGLPSDCGAPSQWILGQKDAIHVDHNGGNYWPCARRLNMPYGVTASGDWLIVADTANSRLLGWHQQDLAMGADAKALAGQSTFHKKGDNQWGAASPETLCWPYGLSSSDGMLAIADSGNNRAVIRPLHRALLS